MPGKVVAALVRTLEIRKAQDAERILLAVFGEVRSVGMA